MARSVVARIETDPSLFNVALENLERWRRLHGTLSRASEEWEQILKRPWSEIREVLLDKSDEGQRLRSSHPFVGIVTEDERWEIIARHPPPPPLKPITRADLNPELIKRVLEDGPRAASRREHEDDEAIRSGADSGQDALRGVSRHPDRAPPGSIPRP